MPIQHLILARAAAKKARLLQTNTAALRPASTLRLASNHRSPATHLSGGDGSEAADSCSASCNDRVVTLRQSEHVLWAAAVPSIVLVSVLGGGWASGIVMSEAGFVLTNAHVLQPRDSRVPHSRGSASHPASVKLRLTGSAAWHVADVVYVFQHVLDLAVLQIRAVPTNLSLQAAVLQRYAVSGGQRIAVVGHALFSPDRNMQPSITSGNISKVVSMLSWPVQCCLPAYTCHACQTLV